MVISLSERISIFMLIILSVLIIGGCSSSPKDSTPSEGSNNTKEVEIEVDSATVEQTEEDNVETPIIPFSIEDFLVEITPTGEIDSAGGVRFSYSIQNNSPIPVQEFSADIKFEFEDEQSMVNSINMYTTIMNAQSVGDSGETIYPEPVSKIKSYKVIAYQIIDSTGTEYEVDLQLETIKVTESVVSETIDNLEFEIEDFVVEIIPTGEIDSAGGVRYSYKVQNNSSIPVKEIDLDVRFSFEDGQSLVDNISIYDTLMNGESLGDSGETIYPEPATKIKSYQLIGYQITDKDDNEYYVDTQLNLVQKR